MLRLWRTGGTPVPRLWLERDAQATGARTRLSVLHLVAHGRGRPCRACGLSVSLKQTRSTDKTVRATP
ncbi:MAG: hypothetical protein NZM28_00720, partial [Fimbriimonadales bacterium]|nr:hypothetical protein [Fimbriimonadales bacterium]